MMRAPREPFWIRMLLRAASLRATDAELGDLVEDYRGTARSRRWFVGQIVSVVRRRRSPLTMSERGTEMLTHVSNDIQHAVRTLRRSPGFAIAAIVPIALGIGINTGIFSLFNSVAWRALPVPESDRLVSVYQDFRGGPRRTFFGARSLFSLPEYRAYRDETQTLAGLMAYSREWTVTLGGESPREISGVLVTCTYFEVLGVSPAIGAGFTPANCGASNGSPVVVLSHALWQGGFGGDPDILERPITLNGQHVTIVGIAPIGFDGIDMAKASFFAPTSMAAGLRPELDLQGNAQVSWLTLIGRRRSGVKIAQVRADLAVVASRIDRQQPGRTTSLIVEQAAALSLPAARRTVFRGASVVMAAFGLVLLMASANVANMLLARATGRTREIAIRLSVGATRWRLVQQLLTESIVIASAGAVCGTLLFWWTFQTLIPALLASFGAEAFKIDATPDRAVLVFALGLAVATALLFGLVPAIQASSGNVNAVIKQDGADSQGGRSWLRGTLIGAQVAVCTILLIPAGLLSRALYAAHTFDPGFDHRNVAAIAIDLRGPRYDTGNAAVFYEQWRERISALPDVERVADASRIPLSTGRSQTTIRLEDRAERHVVDVNAVSPEFFSLLDIPVVRGRLFTPGETDAALVTAATVRRYWPGQDALGRTIAIDGQRRQIVGIVGDAQVSAAPDAISSYVYLPAARGSQRRIAVLARTRTAVNGVAAAVRTETARMDPGLVVSIQPLSANLGLLQSLSQVTAGVAGMLSLLALGLATLGIYGVVSYVVSRRRREVGVRMALGANARDVHRLILGQTLRPVTIGMTIGIAGAAASARVLQSVLFGVSPYDPLAFIGAPLLMLAIATTAALVPTRRAMHVNPMSVLRE